ncbi:MAG: hypothetical protein QGH45_09170 [Myxococcota bacterium]|nr:hypothetical protein [Myxococcota bacterium]
MTDRLGRWAGALGAGLATPILVLSLGCCCGGGTGGDWDSYSAEGTETGAAASSSDEPAPDTASPQTIDRDGFTVQYPGNWTIDSADVDYDPDALFSLDTAGNCFVMFHVFDEEIDLAAATKGQVDEFTQMLSSTTVTSFTTWGAFEGEGQQIAGKFLFLPTTVRAFAHNASGRSFLASEFCYDEDWPAAEPGFEQVRRSFTLK